MRKTGTELFHIDTERLPVILQDFWQWFGSDLLSNALRGVLAEFIVASDLGCSDSVRQEWNAHDLETRTGYKIEVKSAVFYVLPTKIINERLDKKKPFPCQLCSSWNLSR